MKVGDVVKFKATGQVGLVLERLRRCVPDGNPNGDFTIEYRYKVSFGDEIVHIPQSNFCRYVEVVNAS